MERIAVYGKGGIGKTVVATALSAHFAKSGKRVLHVGCDPKHDSAVRLSRDGNAIPTVLDTLVDEPNIAAADRILHAGRFGIACCEAGGPAPGLGCGGRGVARTLELLDELEVIESGGYDVVIFDVLGDVVCGGFAAPLRQGFAEKVLIVTSEEPMALFAANNISRAICTYQRNGVVLAGLVANLKGPTGDQALVDRFAAALSTKVVTYLPRDPEVVAAERHGLTIIEHAPTSAAAAAIAHLAERVAELRTSDMPLPTPFSDDDFFTFMRE